MKDMNASTVCAPLFAVSLALAAGTARAEAVYSYENDNKTYVVTVAAGETATLADGDRVVIVEDVTTSGKSIDETYPKLKAAADVEVVGLMVSLNRQEVGKSGTMAAIDEVSEKYGFPTAAIVTMSEVTEALDGTVITPELKAAIDAYYDQYGVK